MKISNIIFQFKIALNDIEPPIWRRIQVPYNYSFWDLHVAIQNAMGWFDSHLHVFHLKGKNSRKIVEIGIPSDDDFEDMELLLGWEEPIADHFYLPGETSLYEYDFGDSWVHEILLEAILLKEKKIKYPKCIAGQRACPPEDCGGTSGYNSIVEILKDPKHEEYESIVEWLSDRYGKYNSENFDYKKVKFDNPAKRLEIIFSE
jgi:Plasmid pRiA4b ORF-3-like protein